MSEKKCWNDNITRFAFNYLNEKELHNAYLVCKSWWIIGKSVNSERGPLCRTIIRTRTEKHLKFPPRIKILIKYAAKSPSFCIFMTNDEEKYDITERCYCIDLPINCYSIWIENLTPKNKFLRLSSAIFPSTSHVQVNSYTFHCKYSPKGFYCTEIHNLHDVYFLKIRSLKRYFDSFFQIEYPAKYCLILWCRQARLNILKNTIKNLAECYPKNELVIWGGVADGLYVCNKKVDLYICRNTADFTFLFINARHMEVKSLVLDQQCVFRKLIAKKFRKLSENTILKEHSIAFMYTSSSYINKFFKLESSLFKKYFPSVKLVHTAGNEPFGATGLVDMFRNMQIPVLEANGIHTTLMILTFN